MGTVTNSIGSSGRDYSTLASWAASLPANLVTDGNSYVGECYADSEFSGNVTLLTLSGHTTDATHTITLTTAAGQSFRDNASVRSNALNYNSANGVAITGSGTSSGLQTILIVDNYVTLSNLQLKCTAYHKRCVSQSSTNFTMDNCIAVCATSNYNSDQAVDVGGGAVFRNCLFVTTGSTTSTQSVRTGYTGAGDSASFYFCDFVATSDASNIPSEAVLASLYFGPLSFENCAFFGCTAVYTRSFGGGTPTFTTCMTDVASPPSGCIGGKTYANQFENTTTASGDWRAKAGADLQGAGTADSTNGAFDISGLARPQG